MNALDTLAEKIGPFIAQHWQLFVIAVGFIFLAGAVFNWKWICDPNGSSPLGFLAFIYHNFGEKAYRITVGIISIVIIGCGILLMII